VAWEQSQAFFIGPVPARGLAPVGIPPAQDINRGCNKQFVNGYRHNINLLVALFTPQKIERQS
jgi:hypothetical protein